MKSTIVMIIMLWCTGCSCLNAQDLDFREEIPVVHETDVEDVFSSTAAVIQYRGERCLYDITSKCIVERSLHSARNRDGFILTESRIGSMWNYHLYSKILKPIREWKADSSILCASGTVAVKRGSEWTIADVSCSIVYRTSHQIRSVCYPLLVLDSADALFDTRTNEVRLDSVVGIMRWGNGAIVETESNGQVEWISSAYYWFDFSSEKIVDLGSEANPETDNTLHIYDWNSKSRTVLDTNMVVRCKVDRSVMECSDSVRVEYSKDDGGWCIFDLMKNVRSCGYGHVFPDGKGFYIVVQDLRWGLIRYDGTVIIPIDEPVFTSGTSHCRTALLPHFSADNLVSTHLSRDKVRSYYYDESGYHRLFPD